MRKPFCLALLVCLLRIGTSWGHYHLLLPDQFAVKKGETVRLTFLFGHPFEHQLFDAGKPHKLIVLAPDGTRSELLSKLEPISVPGADDKKVKAGSCRSLRSSGAITSSWPRPSRSGWRRIRSSCSIRSRWCCTSRRRRAGISRSCPPLKWFP